MKLSCKVEETFTFSNGDKKVSGFKKVSEWNGFVEFRNEHGKLIATRNASALEIMLNETVFGTGEGIQWTVITASPEIIGMLTL